jgi:hypothetical protein
MKLINCCCFKFRLNSISLINFKLELIPMIKKRNSGYKSMKDSPGTIFFLFICFFGFFISSCSTSKCTLCDIDNRTVYHIELKAGNTHQKKENILSYFPPVPIEAAGKKVQVYLKTIQNTNYHLGQ